MSVINTKKPTLLESIYQYFKLGVLSFGGPAAQIALMHQIFVVEKSWLSEKQYLNALNFCMLLPGPEAMQIATYVGWRLHGTLGGLAAGLLFILPGAIIIFILALLYVYYGQTQLIESMFLGVKAVVVIIVIHALIRISKKALKKRSHWMISLLSFIGIFFINTPYPLIILFCATYGFLTIKSNTNTHKIGVDTSISFLKTLKTISIWLIIWFVPIILIGLLMGRDSFLYQLSIFFSTLATVTFGGAYTVLSYMAQEVVSNYGWLSAGQMMDGLGLAETTPGPLILVIEFVGFLVGFAKGGILMASIATITVLWMTFVPCFLWIFAGAPYIEWVGNQPRLAGALSAITAGVVGVILSLSIWFALHVIFNSVTREHYGLFYLWAPDLSTVNWTVVFLALLSYILIIYKKINIIKVLLISAILSLFIQNTIILF